MPDIESPRVKQFKAAIGFDEPVPLLAPDRGVVMDWPSPIEWGGLQGMGWIVRGETLKATKQFVAREWVLGKGEEALTAEVLVSAAGPQVPRQYLVDVASNTTMVEIPFERGAKGLGQLAIAGRAPDAPYLIWTFHNVCFRLRQMKKTVDVMSVAKWIQQEAEKHVVEKVRDQQPRAQKISKSPEKISVGQTVTVEVLPAGNQPRERYALKVLGYSGSLDLCRQEGLSLGFEGTKAGRGTAELLLIDLKSLLSALTLVTVDVAGSSGR